MTSLLAPTSFDNKEIGIPSSNRNFTQRSLNSNPYRFPYRLSFPLFFFLTSSTSPMGTLLSPSQECHPFYPSSLFYDLVVSPSYLAFAHPVIIGPLLIRHQTIFLKIEVPDN